jgi:hypothetical protein
MTKTRTYNKDPHQINNIIYIHQYMQIKKEQFNINEIYIVS